MKTQGAPEASLLRNRRFARRLTYRLAGQRSHTVWFLEQATSQFMSPYRTARH